MGTAVVSWVVSLGMGLSQGKGQGWDSAFPPSPSPSVLHEAGHEVRDHVAGEGVSGSAGGFLVPLGVGPIGYHGEALPSMDMVKGPTEVFWKPN